MLYIVAYLFVTFWTLVSVNGHGRLMEPPSRSSMWRKGFNTPINYNDNSLFCGGFINEFVYQLGKCGVCGDPFQGPRNNEAGGKYATGTIARHYTPGQIINVEVEITANHKGWFEFRLCPNNDVNKKVTQACLDQHLLRIVDDQSTRHTIAIRTGMHRVRVQLPEGLTCTQCVFQWRYHTGNSFGIDSNGRGCVGCGNQEEFFGCSDISIGGSGGVQPMTTRNPIVITPHNPFVFPTQAPTNRPTPAPTQRPTLAPVQTTQHVVRCHAINNWAGIAYLEKWCNDRCRTGSCPANACACD